jgi:hypothetical protein
MTNGLGRDIPMPNSDMPECIGRPIKEKCGPLVSTSEVTSLNRLLITREVYT